jgi:hypothetical protein
VLGQLFGHFGNAPEEIRWWGCHYGFDTPGGYFAHLTNQWKRVIKERQEGAST